jgi:hypothetical protein
VWDQELSGAIGAASVIKAAALQGRPIATLLVVPREPAGGSFGVTVTAITSKARWIHHDTRTTSD